MLKKYKNILEYFLIWLCLSSSLGAMIYRVFSLGPTGVATSALLSIIGLFSILRIARKFKKKSLAISPPPSSRQGFFLLRTSYLLLIVFLFGWLVQGATFTSLVSPWEQLPGLFLLVYALATLLLLVLAMRAERSVTPLISLHYLLSFSVALIVYRLGYGFDPFVHRATLDLIDATGSVEPKPFYYLSYYSFIIISHKIFFISINILDKLLVPVLAALYLPVTTMTVLDKLFTDKKLVKVTTVLVLILPFSFFIVSTPQNFAYLLLVLLVLRGLTCADYYDLAILYLLAVTAFLAQPIAGIPALLFALIITVHHADLKKAKSYLYFILFTGLITALPAAFLVLERLSGGPAASNESTSQSVLPDNFFAGAVPGQENVILNYLYLYGHNFKFLILLLLTAGLVIAWQHRRDCQIFKFYFLAAAALFVSFLLTNLLPFSFLISYERSQYADRILNIAVIFLLPFLLLSLFAFTRQVDKQNRFIHYALLAGLSLIITASLYFSYPRLDNYHNSHGYSVGQADLEAVTWIENQSEADYIVLANQQTSAAALHWYGFKKYYHDDIFYYPVPTGGALYPYFLEMVNTSPSREIMNRAMDLTGVNEAYFVLNKYWWAFSKIAAEAKLETDSWQEFANGEIIVFKFTR